MEMGGRGEKRGVAWEREGKWMGDGEEGGKG